MIFFFLGYNFHWIKHGAIIIIIITSCLIYSWCLFFQKSWIIAYISRCLYLDNSIYWGSIILWSGYPHIFFVDIWNMTNIVFYYCCYCWPPEIKNKANQIRMRIQVYIAFFPPPSSSSSASASWSCLDRHGKCFGHPRHHHQRNALVPQQQKNKTK